MRIAVVGSGISGLVAAYRLCRDHDISLFEANGYVGGHTHTVDVEVDGERHAVDTGFIVFNDWTYPNFIALLDELKIAWQPSPMSFSVRCEKTGLEYNGANLNTLFAQRRNLLDPRFWGMIAGILRFNRRAPELLQNSADTITLGDYLAREGYSQRFVEHYIVPMAAAIWSSGPQEIFNCPAEWLVRFFANHGLLSVNNRPTWRVIRGGSRQYVTRLTTPFRDRIRLNSPVESIERRADGIGLRSRGGATEFFDRVFIACHSDQALALLADASDAEREILGAIRYQANEAVLHSDVRLLPQRRRTWAAWNYHLAAATSERPTVTYNMNILQSLKSKRPLLVTLNRSDEIDARTVLGRYRYDHPIYGSGSIAAQLRRAEVSGLRGTYYCGAYWGNGFHEDGVNSAAQALREFQTR
jgi:uncharacterized protein